MRVTDVEKRKSENANKHKNKDPSLGHKQLVKKGRVLPQSWLQSYIEYAAGMEAPELFHFWVGLSTIASVVQRKISIMYGGRYELYPNLYIVLVAPHGKARKSTAIIEGQDLLDEIDGVDIVMDKMTPEGLISHLRSQGKPGRKQNKKGSGTFVPTEVKNECCGTIIARDLITLFSKQSYVSDLIGLLTRIYNCRTTHYLLKHGGKLFIPNPCVNFLAASTQRYLAKGLAEDSLSGGFTSRTIFVASKSTASCGWRELMLTPEQKKLRPLLLHDLHRINQLKGKMQITDDAIDYHDEWYHSDERKQQDYSKTKVSGYYERKHIQLTKVAMLLSIAESDALVVDSIHFEAAMKLLNFTERTMEDAFVYVGATTQVVIAEHILDALWATEEKAMYARDLISAVRYLIKSKREFDEIMQLLCEAGYVQYGIANKKPAYALSEKYKKQQQYKEKRMTSSYKGGKGE